MSTAAEVDAPMRRHVPPTHELTFGGLVRSELIKLVTARSLVVLLVLTALCTAGLSIPVALFTEPDAQQSAADLLPTFINTTLIGMQLSIFLIAAIGAIAGASDFGNGTIRLAFGAAPRRTPVLAAKLAAVGGASSALVGVTILVTAVVNWLALTPGPLGTPLNDRASVLSLVGTVVATAGVSVSAISLGCLLRSSAGAIFAILGLLIVLTIALMTVPAEVLPSAISSHSFGAAVTTLLESANNTGRWLGAVAALVAWSGALTGFAVLSLRRRDV
ncbi:ABC transporter permease subunit [Micromonospora sp. NBC_00362]|uniref:ABC transporter permease subunit n=1 Tax=Micromonospora sp. NBC_00362 TaxID=2975975 RepID=UPI002254B37F|nr:ABC transporter permease subunit [Micromonospora sp. NBC_00362]MCX5119367.1 ABC transporter permease subunit [Micromonospora sp. NBC_00362]